MSKNKNVTLDKLADMMEVGFEHVLGRINSVESNMATKEQLGKLEKRVDNIEKTMVTKAEMNRRFDGLEDRVLASHQKRIEKLEAEVKELRGMFAT